MKNPTMTATLFANYGVLSREKQTVYTVSVPHYNAVCSDPVAVEIPDKYKPYLTRAQDVALTLSGRVYMLHDVLTTVPGDKPGLRWYDGEQMHWAELPIVKEA